MNEIEETLAVLKRHWFVVALIVGLGYLPYLLIYVVRLHHYAAMLVSLVAVGITIIIAILSAGFLRTVYLEENKRRSLLELMRIGKHFFLRILVFRILCGLAVMLFVWLLGITITAMESNATFPLANRIGFTFITLLLAKLTILIPAIIIVLDCSLAKSFGLMWKIKLLKAKPLLIFFLIQIVVLPYLLLLFPSFHRVGPAMTWAYALSTFYYIMLRVLALMVQVMAVRFVSSLGISCNEPYEPPESFKLTGII